MAENIASGTAKGLVEYLDSLVAKGRSREGVVAPLKTALLKVLEKTEKENWESVDVTQLDVDDTMARFKNFTLGTYTDASYRAYELRVKRAITWYKNFLASPGWFPKEKQRSPKSDNGDKQPSKSGNPAKASVHPSAGSKSPQKDIQLQAHEPSREAPIVDAMAYPFPLANGKIARVYIPKGISKTDVKRLAVFLEALVIEEVGE